LFCIFCGFVNNEIVTGHLVTRLYLKLVLHILSDNRIMRFDTPDCPSECGIEGMPERSTWEFDVKGSS
jgi:hypothetical protein